MRIWVSGVPSWIWLPENQLSIFVYSPFIARVINKGHMNTTILKRAADSKKSKTQGWVEFNWEADHIHKKTVRLYLGKLYTIVYTQWKSSCYCFGCHYGTNALHKLSLCSSPCFSHRRVQYTSQYKWCYRYLVSFWPSFDSRKIRYLSLIFSY